MDTDRADLAVVWGNCQAEPLADLMRGPLAAAGVRVLDVPPVYLATDAQIATLHDDLARCAVLVTQPIREDLYGTGRGADTIAGLLPRSARVVRIPVTYDVGAFPWQVHGHGADGERVAAPLTVYHDLRTLLGLDPADVAAPAALRAVRAASVAELQRREQGLDVATSDLLDAPDAMWTMTHPANVTLAAIADRILAVLGLLGGTPVTAPAREYLAACRTPLEAAVLAANGWPATAARGHWVLDGVDVPAAEVAAAHRQLYARRPDIAADARRRYATRLGLVAPPRV